MSLDCTFKKVKPIRSLLKIAKPIYLQITHKVFYNNLCWFFNCFYENSFLSALKLFKFIEMQTFGNVLDKFLVSFAADYLKTW